MPQSKVSIIVPFYNTENYIEKCLKALSEQTYSSIEIICINDGSTDSSRAIVEEFQKKDARILLLDLDKGGAGRARNHGLKKATGEYIMFCDSDDTYEPEMVATMVSLISADEEIDVAMCNCMVQGINKLERKNEHYFINNLKGSFELTQPIKRSINIFLWNKIFKSSILNKFAIEFINTNFHEDENFVFKYISVCRNLNSTKNALYNYLYREGSLSEVILDTEVHVNEYLHCIDDFSNFLEKNCLWDKNTQYFAEAINYGSQLACNKNLKEDLKRNLIAGIYSLSKKIDIQKIYNDKLREAIFAIQNDQIAVEQFNPLIELYQTEKSIPIVFCCDNNYIKYLSVALQSIIENASQNYIYHIIILDCGINSESGIVIQKQIGRYANFTFSIVSIREFLEKNKNFFKEKWHFTAAIYGRLIIPEILKNFDKVIYCDTDLIFNRDVAELMQIELKDNYIAATIDIGQEFERKENPHRATYMKQTLSLKTENFYVNSGLLVFNIKKWRELSIHNQCIQLLADSNAFIFPDQDVINILCKNKIYYLDQSWNCTCYAKKLITDNPKQLKARDNSTFLENLFIQFTTAYHSSDPVLHYTGPKPWNIPTLGKAEKWWFYCRKTEFYEQILFECISKSLTTPLSVKREKMEFGNYTKNYYFLGGSVVKIKYTKWSKKIYLFGMRVAKIVNEQNRKKVYILGLRVFTRKVWTS